MKLSPPQDSYKCEQFRFPNRPTTTIFGRRSENQCADTGVRTSAGRDRILFRLSEDINLFSQQPTKSMDFEILAPICSGFGPRYACGIPQADFLTSISSYRCGHLELAIFFSPTAPLPCTFDSLHYSFQRQRPTVLVTSAL
jgi:hypothetical protein